MHAWITVLASDAQSRRVGATLAEGLERTGWAIGSPDDGSHGVVVCDDPDELDRFLQRVPTAESARVLVVTTRAADPWPMMAAGAHDVLPPEANGDVLGCAAARLERWAAIDRLVDSPAVQATLVGSSRAWRRALRELAEAATFSNASILLHGESGTGKELAARLVHALDPRTPKHELVVVDCTTIVPSLSGSELFGHERGAFTGAVDGRRGAFAMADGGTLLLDEIGDLPIDLQPALLRVLQEGTYKPIGSARWQRSSFRVVGATHRDLHELEADGRFRRDLLYRLATVTVRLPALTDRRDDIPMLARHFLRELGSEADGFVPAVARFLVERDYPGNVRDLYKVVSRLALRHVGPGPITVGDLPDDDRAVPGPDGVDAVDDLARCALRSCSNLHELKERVADAAVKATLEDTGGNLAAAATALGVTVRALQLRRAGRRDHDPETSALAV